MKCARYVTTLLLLWPSVPSLAQRGVPLADAKALPDTVPWHQPEMLFADRGKIGSYALPPCKVDVQMVPGPLATLPPEAASEGFEDHKSLQVVYTREDPYAFCGAYLMLLSDLSAYQTISFKIKGEGGGETFEIGLNDLISNKREDAVFSGSIYRYLPNGISTEWQEVRIPVDDFFGPDLSKVYSMVFAFTELGGGTFWIDDVRLHEDLLVDRPAEIREQGYLLVDDFDHSDLNLLGRKSKTFHALPSTCLSERSPDPHGDEARGRVMRLDFDKQSSGWCGYYTLLNQIDGAYYDLTPYVSVSFDVMGAKGGESIELGLSDRNWLTIGDSLRAGNIGKYLPDGITTNWQTTTVPIADFGQLNLEEMGAFVMNFDTKDKGTLYVDNIRFNLAKP